MAKYRHIHCNFWEDPDVYEWTPEEKYFYLYLMSNPHTTQCGIYQISERQISNETGYNMDTVSKLLEKFIEKEKIVYNKNTKEICIRNWLKHNWSDSPKVQTCIKKELKEVKEQSLIQYLYSIDRLCIDLGEKLKTKKKTKKKKEKKINKEKNPKIKYTDFVFLTEEEYKKLKEKYGEENTKKFIEKLDNYKGSNGKKYKDDYRAILNWVVDEVLKNKSKVESGIDVEAWKNLKGGSQ